MTFLYFCKYGKLIVTLELIWTELLRVHWFQTEYLIILEYKMTWLLPQTGII